MSREDPSRTEAATPKRIKKARDEGSVARSAELTKAIVLLTAVIALRFLVPYYGRNFNDIFNMFMGSGIPRELTPQTTYKLFVWGIERMAMLLLPLMLIIAAVAYIVVRAQVGNVWSFKIKWDRISFNFAGALKQLMGSPETLVRLGRSLLQAFVVGIAPYIVIRQELPHLAPLFHQNIIGITGYFLLVSYKMVCYALVPMVIIGIADLWYSHWRYKDNLMMTKEEIKDERRQAEGDPMVRDKQKRKMFQVIGRRLKSTVPKADVVITNPTHFAVALRYNIKEAPAPTVVAKGADRIAKQIREIAIEHDIPIQENPPLARALYKQVEVGETIPEEMYQAVAAILAKLAKFKHRRT